MTMSDIGSPARYRVVVDADAGADLRELKKFLQEREGPLRAHGVVVEIRKMIASLAHQPNRGTRPPELDEIGVREFREVFFKPYRIIYRVFPDQIVVMLVSDGRRDMRTLLSRRMLAP
ncbi:MAG TPA: type II toxin-antitoxin system RelE/ParE family toxin [Myxococcota bacterium]|nr:type II toxin-antitoxin system RelE/ParE family toxin [Myxococcota bacterium]